MMHISSEAPTQWQGDEIFKSKYRAKKKRKNEVLFEDRDLLSLFDSCL